MRAATCLPAPSAHDPLIRPAAVFSPTGEKGRQSTRCAYSLIETVVAMSLILVLMTVSGTLFTALARSERNAQRAAAAQQTLSRLDTLFRADVHRAKSAALSQDDRRQPMLTLTLPNGGTVRYVAEAAKLERLVESAGATHRDAFRVAEAQWRFEIAGETNRRVELILQRPADTVTQNSQEFLPLRDRRLMAALSLTPSASLDTGATP